jgi:DNA-binding NarL/FixJ family response regulator
MQRGALGNRRRGKRQASRAAPMRILIADDHALFRAGLTHLLAGLSEEVVFIEANSLEQALSQISPIATPDLMLVDLVMSGMGDGPTGIRKIRQLAPDMPLVVLSFRNRPDDVRQAIEAGALGYIPKAASPEVMLKALELVLAGGMYLPPDVFGMSDADSVVPRRGRIAPHPRLTGRQRQILGLLSRGSTNKEMARALGLSSGTVKTHVSRIFQRLGVQNRAQAVAAALSLIQEDPEDGR